MSNLFTNVPPVVVDSRPAKYMLESGDVVTGIIGKDGALYESTPGDVYVYPAGSFRVLNVQVPVEARLPEFPYRVKLREGY